MPDQRNGEIASPQSPPSEIKAADTVHLAAAMPSSGEPSALDPMWQVIRRLPKYARLSAALARDPRVPATSKAMLLAGGIYLVSPIDLVPGIIPVAGQLDDLYVLLTGLQQAIRTSPPEAIDEHFAAIGLSRTIVDEDLATIRAFVRRGVTWSIHKGGQLISRLSKQATHAAQRARRWGESINDQKPL